ncbi:MAG: penicillin-binding transpeptidase domain-containing protein [Eubacteriales bacterium]|nr:penicillin-binding transpeptidase domain-containing protein [Eubacteriales bacterium]
MVNKNQLLRRLLVMGCLLLLCAGLASGQLVQLQLVNGEDYTRRAATYLTTTSTVSAARGELLDRYGRPLVTNKTEFVLTLVGSAWESEGQFERLLDLAARVKADGGELNDMLPISAAAPYSYEAAEGANSLAKLSTYIKDSRTTLGLTAVEEAVSAAQAKQEQSPRQDEDGNTIDEVKALDATKLVAPDAFLEAMRAYLEEKRGMPSGLSDADVRTLVGLYYSMRQSDFGTRTNFTMATGISIDLISYLKEHHQDYKGIDVETEAVRQYDTTYGSQLLGTVGVMQAEQWTSTKNGGPYKEKPGYSINDIIGMTGLEAALEPYLHGTVGSRTVDIGLGGDAMTSELTSSAPQPGDNVITTIDLDLQETAEKSLAENVAQYGRGGAAVALDVNSGEVLAMASYPAYDLATYNKNYNELLADERRPLVNRATSGVYPPGSTFKVLTAIAALEEGVIDANTTFTCDGKFEYGGVTFRCNNHQQPMTLDVTQAIKYSCNVFFYNVGKELTGARLEKWCDRFGLGNVTGIEIGESSGHAAGPTYREKQIEADPTLHAWLGGDDVNAAIGQSDNGFTPLQLANYIAAVVNGGTLYKPTLVKSIKTYDYSDVAVDKQPETIGTIDMSSRTQELVMTGMSEVTEEGGTAASVFGDYPIKVGGKTGTAEMFETKDNVTYTYDNGLFVAFAPFDNPQVVVCVVGEGAEHGSSVAPVVRDIFDTYFETDEPDTVEAVPPENTMVP